METKRLSRDPLWGFIFVVLINHVLSPCVCETLPSSNDLHSELEVDGYVTLSNSSTNREYIGTAISQDKSLLESRTPGDLQLENKSSATQPVNNNQSSSSYSREETAASGFSNADEGGGERTPSGPSLSDGGGIAGAISRLVGLVPMLASRLTSTLGLSRRRRDLPEEERAAHADPMLPQQHLEIIQNLNRYYSSLNSSTKAKDRPTLEQLKAHREYLLHLLQQMRHNNKGKVDIPEEQFTKIDNSSSVDNYGKNLLQDELKNTEQNSLISSSQNISSVFQIENENEGNVTQEQYSSPSHGVDVKNTSLAENQIDEKGEKHDSRFSSRLGQVMSDHSDIQTEDVDKVALLLHQFQTQGDVNLFPKNFLEKLSAMAKNPIRRYSLFQTTPPTFTLKPAANSKLKFPGLSQMEQQSGPNTLSLENDSPLSFLQTALKVGSRPPGLESSAGDNIPTTNLLAEPSRFSDLPTFPNAIQSVNQAMDEPPPLSAISPINTPSTINFQGPNNMEQVGRPISNLPGFQNGLPLSLLGSVIQTGPGNLDSLAEEDLPPSPTLGVFSQFPDYGPPNSILGNTQVTEDPNVVIVDGVNFQDIGPLGVPLSSVAFNASDVVPATIQDNRISNELTTALTNFINNIATAIGQLLTDLQAALEANPLAVLLLLLPLLLLPFLLKQGGGGGGGYGHRRVIFENPHSKIMTAERLAQKILTDIDHYEKLFMNDKDRYLKKRTV